MLTPIIMLKGAAGVGKDTVAALIKAQDPKIISLAMADPIKRLASKMFGIPYAYLWGDSIERSKPIEGFSMDPIPNIVSRVHIEVENIVQVIAAEDPVAYQCSNPMDTLSKYLAELKTYSKYNPVTTRYILQTLGTEWGRNKVHQNLWVLYAIRTINRLLVGGLDYTSPGGLAYNKNTYYNAGLITDGRFRNEVLKAKNIGCTILHVSRSTELSDLAKRTGAPGHQSEAELETIPDYWADYILVNQDRDETELNVRSFLTQWKSSSIIDWKKDK
jgi:hypothetical protein